MNFMNRSKRVPLCIEIAVIVRNVASVDVSIYESTFDSFIFLIDLLINREILSRQMGISLPCQNV